MARKSLILQLSLATIIGMPMVALIVDRYSETVDLKNAFFGRSPFWEQMAYGMAAGIVIAIIARLLIASPLLKKINTRYANLFGRFQLNTSEVVFVSLCAGVGEEILFRGAIQPFLGLVMTSVFFVAIHGYLNPRNWRLSLYGLYMTIAICIVGFLSETKGLLTAIIAHTVIDILLIFQLQKTAGEVSFTENPSLIEEEEKNEEDQF